MSSNIKKRIALNYIFRHTSTSNLNTLIFGFVELQTQILMTFEKTTKRTGNTRLACDEYESLITN